MSPLRIALAQVNPTVGDLDGNAARIVAAVEEARGRGAQIVLVPELALCGYPPEDLLLKAHFLADCRAALERVAAAAEDIVAVVGFPERDGDVHNAAAVCAGGEVQGVYRKAHLPNYGVFDELRHFQPGVEPATIAVDGVLVGLTICEDIWEPAGPAAAEALAGAGLVVNVSASPYEAGKPARREAMLAQRARDHLACVAFCAQVGGQDELVFDGHSLVCDHRGRVVARAPGFDEALLVCDVDVDAALAARLRETRRRPARREAHGVRHLGSFETAGRGQSPGGDLAPPAELPEEVYRALVLGVRDYVTKNGFPGVVLGLSGGIDSALVALVACDALGPERVTLVSMPSRYSSEGTRSDARRIAESLGARCLELPIEGPYEALTSVLAAPFAGLEPDVTEENLQARIRGTVVMALSNKHGWLALTTGNKSEMSVGYATLYGDMAGGFAVLKDVFKGWVYRLVRWRNEREGRDLVPASVLDRPPSAELRYEQRDDQSLPPYDVLDAILEGYVEEDLGREQLIARGLPADDVERIIRMVDGAEHKRRQAPPGIRISTRAFGRDRRLPVTNRYRG